MDKPGGRGRVCPKCGGTRINMVDWDVRRKYTCRDCWHVWFKQIRDKGG